MVFLKYLYRVVCLPFMATQLSLPWMMIFHVTDLCDLVFDLFHVFCDLDYETDFCSDDLFCFFV